MSDLHHGHFRHIVGPKSRKAGYRDFSEDPWYPGKPEPQPERRVTYCRCPGGDAIGAGSGPCLITAHHKGIR